MKLLLVDDQAGFRLAVRSLLDDFEDHFEVGEAGDGPAALQLSNEQAWDVAVVDLHLPGMSGLEILDQLHAQAPLLPVILCTFEPIARIIAEGFRRGALGFVAKEDVAEELMPAIASALRGHTYRSQAVQHLLEVESVAIAASPAWPATTGLTLQQRERREHLEQLAPREACRLLVAQAREVQRKAHDLNQAAATAIARSREVCERAEVRLTIWMGLHDSRAQSAAPSTAWLWPGS